AGAVAIGKPAVVTVPALLGDTLRGRVARTAGSLDPTARTLLTEVRVANPSGVFLPGMYAQVQLALGAGAPPLRVPAASLVIRDGPPQVVTVGPDSTVRYQTVTLGRHGLHARRWRFRSATDWRRCGRAVRRRQRCRHGADDEGHGNPTVR